MSATLTGWLWCSWLRLLLTFPPSPKQGFLTLTTCLLLHSYLHFVQGRSGDRGQEVSAGFILTLGLTGRMEPAAATDGSLHGFLWSPRGSVRGQTPSGGKSLIFTWQTLPALPCFMQKLIKNHHLPLGNPIRAVCPTWGMQTAAPACIYWISASASDSSSKAIHASTTMLYPLVALLRVYIRICHSHCPFLLALQVVCTFL